ncbi:phosphoribosylformylglycinamidine synthase subunit PurL [Alkaliphilus sp. B6464]|uniref:phosphoribosylformylglycinamidine synthase subunit PurL n=1 Tax=Alkaliphilus sp. B6464 TaxID=2731219 RepID=UPI001BABE31C|nr:phosphoribosylformylglycinamidine synthase subunit PurL [Alkaliphilus sp. B6464]QUH19931.1 phosphoribosylformylglycinamidine synthase subunit PurL [Alkaliphilus sp. B6464]
MENKYETLGLKKTEYERIVEILGREPNELELNLYSAMWSEHCSYKHSRILFKHFPTSGKRVLQGPGENAGIVDIGDNMAIAMKIESHNHPSAIEPYQGAATGVGGILRDIYAMGARPIALLSSLRFGDIKTDDRTKFLVEKVFEGMADYCDGVDVPAVGGEIYFNDSYQGNPLVNAMCIGLINHDKIHRANASGVGNSIMYLGAATGRDGIGGASFASAGLENQTEGVCPIGNPEIGKKLLEASLELLDTGCIVGLQDLGAAGLTSASCETATRGEGGMEIDVLKVPRRVEGMLPVEVMISESQERMLLIVEKGREEEVNKIVEKWGLHSVIIGKVTDDNMLTIKEGDKIVGKVPAASLDSSGAPKYDSDFETPKYIDEVRNINLDEIKEPENYNDVLLKLLASPNIASRDWMHKQFNINDTEQVEVKAGSAASVIKIKGTNKGIALTTDCNSRYCYLDPREGSKIAVVEASRNLVCSGAKPLAVTDGLNFGNPETKDGFWQLRESALGIGEACRELDTPVVGGNVSLYNETETGSIYPTPIIGMIGLIEDINKSITMNFKEDGDVVILLGKTKEELGGSEYLAEIHGLEKGKISDVNFALERRLHKLILDANDKKLLQSAQDVSEGGLAVALAECAMENEMGVEVKLDSELRKDIALFGESQSRFIISVRPENLNTIKELIAENKIPNTVLGTIGGESFKISISGEEIINLPIEGMKKTWKDTFELLMK